MKVTSTTKGENQWNYCIASYKKNDVTTCCLCPCVHAVLSDCQFWSALYYVVFKKYWDLCFVFIYLTRHTTNLNYKYILFYFRLLNHCQQSCWFFMFVFVLFCFVLFCFVFFGQGAGGLMANSSSKCLQHVNPTTVNGSAQNISLPAIWAQFLGEG